MLRQDILLPLREKICFERTRFYLVKKFNLTLIFKHMKKEFTYWKRHYDFITKKSIFYSVLLSGHVMITAEVEAELLQKFVEKSVF